MIDYIPNDYYEENLYVVQYYLVFTEIPLDVSISESVSRAIVNRSRSYLNSFGKR